jgi:hypothetical protein
MWVSPRKTMSFTIVDRVGITVCAPGVFADDEWDAYGDAAEQVIREGTGMRTVLNLSPKHGPNAAQRRRLVQRKGARFHEIVRIALISDSAMVRGAITAMQWLVGSPTQTKTYRPSEHLEAARWAAEGAGADPTKIFELFLLQLDAMDYERETLEYRGTHR